MESLGPGHGTECFQDCSFLAAAPSEQATLARDRRGVGSLGRDGFQPLKGHRREGQLAAVGMESRKHKMPDRSLKWWMREG